MLSLGIAWLRARRKAAAMFLLLFLVCFIVFYLCRLPLPPIAYAGAIFLFFLGIFSAADFAAFCRTHRLLTALRQNILVAPDQLPEAQNQTEEDYQAIIRTLLADISETAQEERRRQKSMTDYYTLWAHQIKTPIAAMELMLQDDGPLSRRELSEELRRIEQYAEMVLCYLRLDSDSTDYLIQEYPVDSIVKQAIRHYASQFIRKKIRLDYTPIPALVLTDEKWFLFVLEQILSNALKYTPAGSISISLSEPGVLCIRDTGIGIAAEDLPRIFENGYTGGNGRTDKKASGIGLYLCRRICQSLGHEIRITSVPGEGTSVFLSIRRGELEVE